MEKDKQSQPATSATPHTVSPTTTERLRGRVAPVPKAETIELSSLPPHTDTQNNNLAVPKLAHISNADTSHQITSNFGTTDEDHDHHRIHLPAIHTKQSSELSSLQRFWARHVSLAVEHEACRDHLGRLLFFLILLYLPSALPRTHAYLRHDNDEC